MGSIAQNRHAHGSDNDKELQGGAIYAALDLGTNNCRLLVARPLEHGSHQKNAIRVIDSFSRIVRLGEDLSHTGRLSDDAIRRTIDALKLCKQKLDRYAITEARFVATEACRRAQNAEEFLARVCSETDLLIDTITSEEEARLAFIGCAGLLSEPAEHAIAFDIGGGSTEFMWVDVNPSNIFDHTIKDWFSLQSGVMNLSERFGGNAFAEMYFEELVGRIMAELAAFDDRNAISGTIQGKNVQMLSTSGTATTLAAIHLGLPRYDRSRIDGITLKVADIQQTIRTLLAMRPSERFAHPCIGPDRSDFIISGCAIFEAIARLWPTQTITIADRGVREGIILSLLHGHRHGN